MMESRREGWAHDGIRLLTRTVELDRDALHANVVELLTQHEAADERVRVLAQLIIACRVGEYEDGLRLRRWMGRWGAEVAKGRGGEAW